MVHRTEPGHGSRVRAPHARTAAPVPPLRDLTTIVCRLTIIILTIIILTNIILTNIMLTIIILNIIISPQPAVPPQVTLRHVPPARRRRRRRRRVGLRRRQGAVPALTVRFIMMVK